MAYVSLHRRAMAVKPFVHRSRGTSGRNSCEAVSCSTTTTERHAVQQSSTCWYQNSTGALWERRAIAPGTAIQLRTNRFTIRTASHCTSTKHAQISAHDITMSHSIWMACLRSIEQATRRRSGGQLAGCGSDAAGQVCQQIVRQSSAQHAKQGQYATNR